MTQKIGILGSGGVAQTLAGGFLKHGYPVQLGTRSPDKLKEFQQNYPDAKVSSFSDVAAWAEIIVLAVKGSAAISALDLAGKANLAGKIVIDPTNPIADAPPQNGVLQFFSSINRSLMEDLQAACPQARFVKAWSMIGGPHMVNPEFPSRPTMFLCGNDAEARKTVSAILSQFGFDPEDMGMAEAARAIEPLCMLWCIPGLTGNSWNHALKLIRK